MDTDERGEDEMTMYDIGEQAYKNGVDSAKQVFLKKLEWMKNLPADAFAQAMDDLIVQLREDLNVKS